jgi:hypothetical protein
MGSVAAHLAFVANLEGKMRKDKLSRAMQVYDGFKGQQTVSHVMSTIPDAVECGFQTALSDYKKLESENNVAWESSSVEAWGSSRVVARESSRIDIPPLE